MLEEQKRLLFTAFDDALKLGGKGSELRREFGSRSVTDGVHQFQFARQNRTSSQVEGSERAGQIVGGIVGGSNLGFSERGVPATRRSCFKQGNAFEHLGKESLPEQIEGSGEFGYFGGFHGWVWLAPA